MPVPLSHPFRFDPSGVAVTVEDGTDQAAAEAIAVLVGTVVGERAMAPGFGITDPTFAAIDQAEVETGLMLFGPDGVTVTGVTEDPVSDTEVRVAIEFETDDQDDNDVDDEETLA